MLSDHERRTLEKIQSEVIASRPEFAQRFAAGETDLATPGLRRGYLIWAVAATAAILMLLSLAVGLTTGAFYSASLVLCALLCQLWWLHRGSRLPRRVR